MPNKNGTGPLGEGPMTGRGMGNCQKKPGQVTGKPRGMGFGRGLRNRVIDQEKVKKEDQN